MSAVGRRPESRTKEELKRELKKRGVEFHNNATKDELVRLFREQKVGRSAMELSSDEEGSRSPARRRKVRRSGATLWMGMMAFALCLLADGNWFGPVASFWWWFEVRSLSSLGEQAISRAESPRAF